MYKSLYKILFILIVTGINITAQKTWTLERQDLSHFFSDYKVDGCFILFNPQENLYVYVNKDRADSSYLPASTFKIPHTLIALETGIAADSNFTIEWDGNNRSVESWNRTHNLSSAIKNSVVWFFEETARRIGKDTLKSWLEKLDYGNRDVSGTDPFWLKGNLKISPNQQIEFIQKFYNETLPFKKSSFEIVKNAIVLENNQTYKLSGKTGWAQKGKENIGWLLGYIEKGSRVYFYVTNIVCKRNNPDFSKARFEISKSMLKELGITPNYQMR